MFQVSALLIGSWLLENNGDEIVSPPY